MAQAAGLFLADIMNIHQVRGTLHFLQERQLLLLQQVMLQFEMVIEVILDGTFAFAGHDDDIFNP
ncbi:hypothetical protein D3C81_1836660 [compost metagenome]